MIKISWGTKIAVLYIGFALLMGVMVTLCIHQKIDLVSDDYYERELKFQNKIDEVKNADALGEKITHQITDQNINLVFPQVFKGKNVTGEIIFFRPSDARKDYKTVIQLNNDGQQLIPINKLSKGMYKIQADWRVNDIDYFSEETIVIP